jgi:hypothetical protein
MQFIFAGSLTATNSAATHYFSAAAVAMEGVGKACCHEQGLRRGLRVCQKSTYNDYITGCFKGQGILRFTQLHSKRAEADLGLSQRIGQPR